MLSFILATILLANNPPPLSLMGDAHEIVIQNRILTSVGGKNFSVLDVVKEMDVFLSEHYPHYMQSKIGRYQFYSSQWRQTLQQMVDHELMFADAESKEIKVTDGEVREEIQRRFGPNVMASLDQLGLSYEEARKMVHKDMVVQRIQWFRVTSKALQKVTSHEIKNAYDDYLQKNPAKEEWTYQFITLRDEEPDQAQNVAHHLMDLKEKAKRNLTIAAELCKNDLSPDTKTTISVSQEFHQEDKDLSQMHKMILSQLKKGQWSNPTAQKTRDGKVVTRIFHLKDHVKIEHPPFAKLANDLKQQLLNEAVDRETKNYLTKLHSRFNFNEKSLDIPPHFEPFSIK